MTAAITKNNFLRRVEFKNYRSIGLCDLELGPLTFLVGPNGAGKSNLIDGLRLVADSLNTTLDHALRERGGVEEVRRRSSGHPTNFGIRLDFSTSDDGEAWYAFEVGAARGGGFQVKREECHWGGGYFEAVGEEAKTSLPFKPPPASPDRLYLVAMSGFDEFRPVYDGLTHMGFYSINPERIRALQPPDSGELLKRDGSNLASVISRLDTEDGRTKKDRVRAFLASVVPGVVDFAMKRYGHMESIEFRQTVKGATEPWRFPALNMSDGTLRALAILAALSQNSAEGQASLVAIEEPEAALHPLAAGALRDAIIEASEAVQVMVTSHSAELLDDTSIPERSLFSVEMVEGVTEIAGIDEPLKAAIREKMCSPGELLRQGQLKPRRPQAKKPNLFARRDPAQQALFDESAQ